ncbi:tRNA (adenosine(37)-N6)-dimethylallyltransferase MiaA [Alteromonas alba]|uniref:tRNA dimethylallyltransferase n=1 Tax=Alteromonas alba TaxID=2079529 RepID=A0A2S9V930_9ALTE|nr:tRNA (adenosine(37)-N6)-dimethylallyltransferase MiaA [Alteromonas alba]PRO72933.1 tRNA (adenosine(37)-N6)-dimethylallyltransferase MiaA [Alteromonas alba]|tara:strand:- start:30372 stop:31298 length:927 start_codon:yes stop_codon:yes gene_type:complete
MSNQTGPVVSIMGPTASGKTGLALELASQVPAEIISVDSALVYKHMNIGTAKPTAEEMAVAPHWLVDIIEPTEAYSVADFVADTTRLIGEIHGRGKLPILVGGTIMYFNALINGISPLPKSDSEIREAILREANERGWQAMHADLERVDPVSAGRIHPNDPQRLTRALEVYRSSGKSLTHWQEKAIYRCPYKIDQFAIAPHERAVLHSRIAERFDLMLAQGLVEEVKALYERGDLHEDMPAIRAVGYRQVWQYLKGELSYADMRDKGIIATRQLAKRQLTWLRGWPDLTWLDTFAKDNLTKITAKVTL